MLKIVVGQNPNDPTEYGYVAGDDDNFGTCIPDTIDGTLITSITSKGGDISFSIPTKVFGDTLTLTSAAGATGDLTWDDATKTYKGTTPLAGSFKSHYEFKGILEVDTATGTGTVAQPKPPTGGTTTPPTDGGTPATPAANDEPDSLEEAIQQCVIEGISNDDIKVKLGVSGAQIGAAKRKMK